MATVSKGITPDDRKNIEEILRSTGFFYEFEIQTALEIADETLAKGVEKSGYYWLKIVDEDGFAAFANYGKNAFLNTFMGPLLDCCSPEFKEQEAWFPASESS